ncbi:MAG TPA: cyclopropane-fatty-acyl-phospholipid synthase family protein [Xanthobacteraceae bacterium]|jgi:cyclopropane-fatty-acyl-phospholipid synthase|nr:cyclopropane-fatty-acyl-phospholipid synthase family protein [Xanthobacteraceae bacterium]
MDRALEVILRSYIRHGTLRLTTAGGKVLRFGDATGVPIAVRFTTRAAQWGMLLDPELKVGEAYTNGTLVMERGSIAEFLALAMSQDKSGKPLRWARVQWLVRYVLRRLAQFNPPKRSRRNVAHHYDIDRQLYGLFLDADRQYSCAYFEHPEQSLDDAQLAKKRHVVAKLLVDRGQRVLDIGSGWGGMGLYIAEMAGARVTGVTLSEEQFALSRARADEKGLAGRVEFRLQDYRDIAERFDRIVSVGMFEHVGVGFYDIYFRKCSQVLADDGVMLLHSIGRSEGPGITNPWINKYIFPGGYIPALSEVLPAVERAGFLVTDIEILRLHYAETLKHWRQRFLAHRDDLPKSHDERFVRMWEFYLAASEMAFREQNLMVMQLQLTKRQGVVPITRDYIAREEARLRGLESGSRPPLRLAGE